MFEPYDAFWSVMTMHGLAYLPVHVLGPPKFGEVRCVVPSSFFNLFSIVRFVSLADLVLDI